MDVVTRWLAPEDVPRVRALFEMGHPGWPARPRHWFHAYPTLVAVDAGRVIGFTSLSLGSLHAVLMLHGQDLVVDPDWRGRGVGGALHAARLSIGQAMAAGLFSGVTSDGNHPMQRIFLSAGHHACQRLPAYYPDGADGVVWLGAVGG